MNTLVLIWSESVLDKLKIPCSRISPHSVWQYVRWGAITKTDTNIISMRTRVQVFIVCLCTIFVRRWCRATDSQNAKHGARTARTSNGLHGPSVRKIVSAILL